jgi:GntR family transcriptional regulator
MSITAPPPLAVHPPLYAQVEAALAERIAAGEFGADGQMPSEDELTAAFQVSRTTIRTAIQGLVRRGLAEIRRGRGTFVATPAIVQELTSLTGFVEDMEALGKSASARLLEWREVRADATVARQLALPLAASVIRIRRTRLADGIPLSYDETFLPKDLGERIVMNDLEAMPIFTLLEEQYDTPLEEAQYLLQASVADETVSEALGVRPGSPVFLIERTSHAVGGRPVDYERLHYRGDRMRLVTRLARKIPAGGRR